MAAHDWPGNVRELQNLIERAVILSDGPDLAFDPGWLVGASAAETAKTWAAQERQRILDALRAAGGRVYGPGGAAHRLGLNPTTLYGKMRKHGHRRTPAGVDSEATPPAVTRPHFVTARRENPCNSSLFTRHAACVGPAPFPSPSKGGAPWPMS